MATTRHALLIFSKVPEPGLVKTRLSNLKDGWYKPEVASWLYHCMLFDVVETCCVALEALESAYEGHSYDLVVSTTPADHEPLMRDLFASSGEWPREIHFIHDEGASFDEHYNDAFAKVWDMGAESILSLGADMPALTKDDVIRSFEQLHRLRDGGSRGIVLAPDQELGVSIVGWNRETEFDHTGIYYNRSGLTVLPAYVRKAKAAGIPVRYLPPVPDVDTMMDLFHNATLVEAQCYAAESTGDPAPWRTAEAMAELKLFDFKIAPNDLHDPRESIDK